MKAAVQIMDMAAVNRSIIRIAHEIIERNAGEAEICLVGIYRGGAPLAGRLGEEVARFSDMTVHTGWIDVTRHRDDVVRTEQPAGAPHTNMEFAIDGKVVVLVDDVIETGRTVRAAMDALMEQGRPAKVQLAVLIDRGHRELPVRGDYIGKNVPTSKSEKIRVVLPGSGEETGVLLYHLSK